MSASPNMAKPILGRSRSIEYDRSILRPMSKRITFSFDQHNNDNGPNGGRSLENSQEMSILPGDTSTSRSSSAFIHTAKPLLTKQLRSALGTTAFIRTIERDESFRNIKFGSSTGVCGGIGTSGGQGSADALSGEAHLSKACNVERIADSIGEALMNGERGYGAQGIYRYSIRDPVFEPMGSTWVVTVVMRGVESIKKEDERAAFEAIRARGAHTFRVRIVLRAVPDFEDELEKKEREESGESNGYPESESDSEEDEFRAENYVVDVDMLPPSYDDEEESGRDGKELMVDFGGRVPDASLRRSSTSPSPEAQRTALVQKNFEEFTLDIKKAVVKCEFPEFPEGCKGRPFREVYQLNARVSSSSLSVEIKCVPFCFSETGPRTQPF